jgi:hypothetical protein
MGRHINRIGIRRINRDSAHDPCERIRGLTIVDGTAAARKPVALGGRSLPPGLVSV